MIRATHPLAATGAAPGRVNLLGEHTDYNAGLVLPSAVPLYTRVAMRTRESAPFRLESRDLNRSTTFGLGEPAAERFALYVQGCLLEVEKRGAAVPWLDIRIESDIPMGVGLSSSAALEVATLRALRTLLDLRFDDIELARLAQQAEITHAGVHCGILDQMACTLLEPGSMLLLDTRSLHTERIPLPAHAELLVLDSGISRTLSASPYNTRRAECDEAARLLKVDSLRDAVLGTETSRLSPTLLRRVRHVVSENERVRAAVSATAPELGRLMSASHASLRDDFDVSVPALDTLVGLLWDDPDVYGAKLTGAGFGGACVALCRAGTAAACATRVLPAYADRGYHGSRLIPQ